MLLRRSGIDSKEDFNLNAVMDTSQDSGIASNDTIAALVETFMAGEWDKLTDLRTEATKTLGLQQMTDCLTVACGFNGITRVANATGIPLDPPTEEMTKEMRQITQIDDFDEDIKLHKYG